MLNNDKHIQKIIRYLSGEMTDKDRYAFERSMEADPFLRDAVDGYEKLSKEEIRQALDSLHDQFRNPNPKQLPVWVRIAAVGMLVLGIGSLLMIDKNKNKDGLVADQIELETKHEDLAPNQSSSSLKKVEPEIDVNENKEKSFVKTEDNREPKRKMSKVTPETEKVLIVSDDVELNEEMELDVDSESETLNFMMADKIQGVEVEGKLKTDEYDNQQGVLRRGISSFNEMIVYKGKVVDEEGFPLPGVKVIDQGTLKGTITDMEGNFEINIPKQKKGSLAFNSIGFKSQHVKPKGDSLGEIVLKSDDVAMDEVVVGYGSVKKRSLEDATTKTIMNDSLAGYGHSVPEPKIGMTKFIKKIQRGLKYPFKIKDNSIEIEVEIFISVYGEVKDIRIQSDIDEEFAVELKKKIVTTSKWIPPQINGIPVEGERLVLFKFD